MKRALTITAILLTCVLPAAAAEHGPAYPSDSNRGPAFPKFRRTYGLKFHKLGRTPRSVR